MTIPEPRDNLRPVDYRAFAFVITLAAVINGLGMVSLLTSLAQYLRRRHELTIRYYWVFGFWAAFQFVLHIVFWWSLWNAREVSEFTFATYAYLICGPIALYLATSVLLPLLEGDAIDLEEHYYRIHRTYFSIGAIFCLWAIFLWPALLGRFAPTLPAVGAYLAIAITLRFSSNRKLHGTLTVAAVLLLAIFIAVFAMGFGELAERMG